MVFPSSLHNCNFRLSCWSWSLFVCCWIFLACPHNHVEVDAANAFVDSITPSISLTANFGVAEGLCPDIAGYGANLNCNAILQLHTCKSQGADTQFVFDVTTGEIRSVNYDVDCGPLPIHTDGDIDIDIDIDISGNSHIDSKAVGACMTIDGNGNRNATVGDNLRLAVCHSVHNGVDVDIDNDNDNDQHQLMLQTFVFLPVNGTETGTEIDTGTIRPTANPSLCLAKTSAVGPAGNNERTDFALAECDTADPLDISWTVDPPIPMIPSPATATSVSKTESPSEASTWSNTKTPGESPRPTPSEAPSSSPTWSNTETPGDSPRPTPSEGPSSSPTWSNTETPGESPRPTPSEAPSSSPTWSNTKTPGESPRPTPSEGPSSSSSPTMVVTDSSEANNAATPNPSQRDQGSSAASASASTAADVATAEDGIVYAESKPKIAASTQDTNNSITETDADADADADAVVAIAAGVVVDNTEADSSSSSSRRQLQTPFVSCVVAIPFIVWVVSSLSPL